MDDEKQKKDQPRTPAWQSARSEAWARGEKDLNPTPAHILNRHPTRGHDRTEREEGEQEEVRTQPGDTPEMIEKRKQMQRRDPEQSNVGSEPLDGFQME